MQESHDEHYMRQALSLARRGQGRVEPNPMVGAVLVRDERIVAKGYHKRFGGPHAEIEVLRQCQRQGVTPAGGDWYVTLEPCCHQGKTGPCADALIEAGIQRVFVAMLDPNSMVAGKGIEQLRQAGIDVQVGVCQAQAQQLNEPYIKHMATGLPWVIAKWAQTLDGRIATAAGDSKWISNARSRRVVHQLRARVDAVVVGIGTVLADDPRLTARDVPVRRHARRVVIDPRLELPDCARLLERSRSGDLAPPLTVAISDEVYKADSSRLVALQGRGVELIGLPMVGDGVSRLDLRPLFKHLADTHAATNVLVEGGSKLFGAVLEQRLVDQVIAFVAPSLMGDAAAVPAVQGLTCQAIDQAQRLSLQTVKRLDDDVMLDYRVRHDD